MALYIGITLGVIAELWVCRKHTWMLWFEKHGYVGISEKHKEQGNLGGCEWSVKFSSILL
jgi:hypothetical protein